MKTLYFLVFILNALPLSFGDLQCRDESGTAVDWYVVYKFPRLKDGDKPLDTGYRYAFITSNDKNGWTLSDYGIDDSENSIFAQTLGPIYSSKLSSSVSFIEYNDEVPEGETKGDGAHAKGVVASDNSHGFWLIHSVPHFASNQTTHAYKYPETGGRYGQSALCISMKSSEVPKVITQLLVIQPNVYSMQIGDPLKKLSSDVTDLVKQKWSKDKQSLVHLMSVGGVNFTTFSKNPNYHVELYKDIVAPSLKVDLYVETWRKNPGTPLPSNCSKPSVENVDTLKFNFSNTKTSGSFNYEDDHSKWAIAKSDNRDASHPYVCVGDINRMKSQDKRGGTTTCLQTLQVWKYFDQWVDYVERCH